MMDVDDVEKPSLISSPDIAHHAANLQVHIGPHHLHHLHDLSPCHEHAHGADALPCVLIFVALVASHEVLILIVDDDPHFSEPGVPIREV